jgi:hypothetical protein
MNVPVTTPATVTAPSTFAEHRRHDRGEHHLEHAQVAEVELRGELVGAPEAGALQDEAEGDADQHRHDQPLLARGGGESGEREGHDHSLLTNHANA